MADRHGQEEVDNRAGGRVGAGRGAEGGRREARGGCGNGSRNACRAGSHQEGQERSGRRRRRRGGSQAEGGKGREGREKRKGREEKVALVPPAADGRKKVYAAHCRTWESRSGVSVDAA